MMYRIAASCLISLLLAVSAQGQGYQHDPHFFIDTHPALHLSNAAALSLLEDSRITTADVSFQKENGRLIPLEGSDDAWRAGIETEAFSRVSNRLSFHEKLSYSHFRGKNMGAQILMDPAYNPINFLEEDMTSRGNKKRETYSMEGGIACRLSDALSLGLGVDYTSADQVKYKDPRFQNVWMDLAIRPAVFFRLSDTFRMGVNLEYRKTLEIISAKLYGTLDRDYYILVDQGNFYGGKERFEGDVGYISVSNDRPLSHSFYGLSLQALINRGKAHYCGEFTALYRDGYFGNRSSSSIVFCEFRGMDLAYKGSFLLPQNRNLHKMEVEASFGMLNNYTNQYRYETEIGMTGKIVYLAQKQTFSRTDFQAVGRYTFYGDTSGFLPQWELNACADVSGKFQQTLLYPFSRDAHTLRMEVMLGATRNIAKGKNIYSFQGSASFLMGFGTPREDTVSAGATTTYRSFDNYSDRQFEYETASRIGCGISLKYSRIVSEKCIPYVKLSDSFRTLLSAPQYLDGAGRNIASISLGCSF